VIYLKNPIISENKLHQQREEFNEKDLSAEQHQTEKNPWICGTNEHPRRPKRLEAEEGEGKKEANGLEPSPPQNENRLGVFKKSMQGVNLAIQNAKYEMLIAHFAVLTLQ